jgi:hypothetical protein
MLSSGSSARMMNRRCRSRPKSKPLSPSRRLQLRVANLPPTSKCGQCGPNTVSETSLYPSGPCRLSSILDYIAGHWPPVAEQPERCISSATETKIFRNLLMQSGSFSNSFPSAYPRDRAIGGHDFSLCRCFGAAGLADHAQQNSDIVIAEGHISALGKARENA